MREDTESAVADDAVTVTFEVEIPEDAEAVYDRLDAELGEFLGDDLQNVVEKAVEQRLFSLRSNLGEVKQQLEQQQQAREQAQQLVGADE